MNQVQMPMSASEYAPSLKASPTAALKRRAQKTCLPRALRLILRARLRWLQQPRYNVGARAGPAERKNTARVTRWAFCIYDILDKNEHVKFDTN